MKEELGESGEVVSCRITATGLNKSATDLPPSVQKLLRENGIHDFEDQELGSKIDVAAVLEQSQEPISLRLLRPKSKSGQWNRLSLTRSVINALRLVDGSRIFFRVSDGELLVRAEAVDHPPTELEMTGRPFPAALFRWAGHRSGGVKKPFRRETGRPAGVRVITPLTTRLRDWAELLTKGEDIPRSVLLVGGPGNGKTDAVEGLVDDMDDLLDLQGKLFSAFGDQYGGKNAENPPRRVDVDLSRLVANCPEHLNVTISIVQDATEADPKRFPGMTSKALLLNELRDIANGAENGIYICCVNRGKLAEAYTEAQEQDEQPQTLRLLEEITTAVTSSPQARPCWPLSGYPSIVAWPMDIDTLVEGHGGESPAIHQILGPALDEGSWPSDCVAAEMCPFCTNRKLLSEEGALDKLAELLRAFELGSGKRWTFRDLYSLVSYMLVGEEDEFVIDGIRFSPCDWAAKQIDLMNSTKSGDSAKRARALHNLVGRLYWHSLFPLWPRLASKDFTVARKKVIKALHGDLSYVNDLFRYLSFPGRTRASCSIERLVNHVFCGLLDPADADPESTISPATTSDYKVREIDEWDPLESTCRHASLSIL